MDVPPQPLKDSTNIARDATQSVASHNGFWGSNQAPKLLSQLVAREHENKKLRGELKRRKTDGRAVIEIEGEASRLRRELESMKATMGQEIDLKARENESLKGSIKELQGKMQEDLREFQFQVNANKTRQAAFMATMREHQERLDTQEEEITRLRSCVGEKEVLLRELQGQLERSEEQVQGLKKELQVSLEQTEAAETARNACQQLVHQMELKEEEWLCTRNRMKTDAAEAAHALEGVEQRLAEAEHAKLLLAERLDKEAQEHQCVLLQLQGESADRLRKVEVESAQQRARAEEKLHDLEEALALSRVEQGRVQHRRQEEEEQLRQERDALLIRQEGLEVELEKCLSELHRVQRAAEDTAEGRRQQLDDQFRAMCTLLDTQRQQADAELTQLRCQLDFVEEERRQRHRLEAKATEEWWHISLQHLQDASRVRRVANNLVEAQQAEVRRLEREQIRMQQETDRAWQRLEAHRKALKSQHEEERKSQALISKSKREWELHRDTEGVKLAAELKQRRATIQQEAEEVQAQREAAAAATSQLQAERQEWLTERAEWEKRLLNEEQGLAEERAEARRRLCQLEQERLELGELKGQVEEVRMEAEVVSKERAAVTEEWATVRAEWATIAAEKQQLEQEWAALRAGAAEWEQRQELLSKSSAQLRVDAEALATDRSVLHTATRQLEKERAELALGAADAQRLQRRATKEMEEVQAKHSELSHLEQQLQAERKSVEAAQEAASRLQSELEAARDALMRGTTELEAAQESLRLEAARLQRQYGDAATIGRERETLLQEREQLEADRKLLDDRLADTAQEVADAQEQREALAALHAQLVEDEDRGRQELDALRQRLSAQLREVEADRAVMRRHTHTLSAVVNTEAAHFKEVVRLWEGRMEEELALMSQQVLRGTRMAEREADLQSKTEALRTEQRSLAEQRAILGMQRTAMEQAQRALQCQEEAARENWRALERQRAALQRDTEAALSARSAMQERLDERRVVHSGDSTSTQGRDALRTCQVAIPPAEPLVTGLAVDVGQRIGDLRHPIGAALPALPSIFDMEDERTEHLIVDDSRDSCPATILCPLMPQRGATPPVMSPSTVAAAAQASDPQGTLIMEHPLLGDPTSPATSASGVIPNVNPLSAVPAPACHGIEGQGHLLQGERVTKEVEEEEVDRCNQPAPRQFSRRKRGRGETGQRREVVSLPQFQLGEEEEQARARPAKDARKVQGAQPQTKAPVGSQASLGSESSQVEPPEAIEARQDAHQHPTAAVQYISDCSADDANFGSKPKRSARNARYTRGRAKTRCDGTADEAPVRSASPRDASGTPSRGLKYEEVDSQLFQAILAGEKQPKGFWRDQPRLMRPRKLRCSSREA
eukprot:GGOE01002830.1.p1 GENE.GGOE01002830.1~~GGOE01002830.1.p1  ORF type:complete len:1365 (+),score=384.47 GGOE01002830.1:31-4125(+)